MFYDILTNYDLLANKLTSDTLLVLDIDDSIITSDEYIGSPHWWDSSDDEKNLVEIWETQLKNLKYKVICNSFYKLLSKCDELGNNVIFLTKRHDRIKNITVDQLKKLKIIEDENKFLIYHTNNEDKGEHMIKILKNNSNLVKNNIIVCDDIINNLLRIKQEITLNYNEINTKLYLVKITRSDQENIENIW